MQKTQKRSRFLWLLIAAAVVMTAVSAWKMAGVLREHILSEQGFSRLEVTEEELQQGTLVLVNRENAWGGTAADFVQVFANKTGSYSVKDKTVYVHGTMMQALNDMMDSFYAVSGSSRVIVTSGYRDETLQQSLYDTSAAANGKDHADRFVAPAGRSEHHTGLAVDLGLYDTETGIYTDFDGTGDCAWFAENCADYGFILRYTRDKEFATSYADEPWHFRYVGLPHSAYIMEKGLCLEEYIERSIPAMRTRSVCPKGRNTPFRRTIRAAASSQLKNRKHPRAEIGAGVKLWNECKKDIFNPWANIK